jgi:predicted component of type VI protein secretion system
MYAMSQPQSHRDIPSNPRSLSDVITRIDAEIQSIDGQLKNLEVSVEKDLKELFDTQAAAHATKGGRSFPEFQAKYQARLTSVKAEALEKAKRDLEGLRREILRARSM